MRNKKKKPHMAGDYTKLRRKLFLQTAGVVFSSVLIIVLLREFLRGSIAGNIISLLQRWFRLDYEGAENIYQYGFRNNYNVILLAAIFALFVILSWVLIRSVTRYFDCISHGLDAVMDGKGEVELPPELNFMEVKLKDIRISLETRELKATEAEQKKNNLIVYLAHDIRTPLTSVIAYLSLLNEAPDMPVKQRAKYLRITLDKAMRLDKLINEFFEIARYNHHSIVLCKQEVDLGYMLTQVADELYPIMIPSGKEICLHIDEGIRLCGDPDKLARVFNNVLKNAISYSAPHSRIDVGAHETDGSIVITFENSGETIPPEKLNTIFEQFYRLDEGRSTNTGGSGLGLAIAKEIVDLHEGEIAAKSSEGKTAFTITLPYKGRIGTDMQRVKEVKIMYAAHKQSEDKTAQPARAHLHADAEPRIQSVKEHLEGVSELAAEFASAFGAEELGALTGLAHDIGKYTARFQKRIREGAERVDHSTAGAQEIMRLRKTLADHAAAYCVMGHHTGLPNGGMKGHLGEPSEFYSRLQKDLNQERLGDYTAYRKEVSLSPAPPPPVKPVTTPGFMFSFMTRMLYSCLVDADYLDTEAFMKNGAVERGGYASIDMLHENMQAYINRFSKPENELNEKRTEILNNCLERAGDEPGLFTLTVPTGGGKTIASLAFALAHAKKHGKRRVIYVIPYTSIIEQTADVFSKILSPENVLEHHSNASYDNEENGENLQYLSTQNWDAPIIVTTNVQFFESLFAARSSACRKLHNIAESVLVFDEAQMLPIPYLKPCVHAISELVGNYHCTAVLCTATQPALNTLLPETVAPREICAGVGPLYDFFRRVTYRHIGALSDEQLAQQLLKHTQTLCIVNNRKHAQALFALLEGEGNYHLSTTMYPQHRRSVLKEIRERLRKELPCRVVSTSLVEAGVDLDFPAVYRAEAGLDSIIQAAGRCNREGKRDAEESFLYIFEPDGTYATPLTLKQPLAMYRETARRHAEDIASPAAIHEYFSTLFLIKGDEALDEKNVCGRLEDGMKACSFPFKDIGQEFRLIEEDSVSVLIPIAERAQELYTALRAGAYSRKLMREAGFYSVSVRRREWNALYQAGVVAPIGGDKEMSVLERHDCYGEDTGIRLEVQGGQAEFA